jgi:membrane protein DedA with SNARE-associated domain
VLHSIAHLVSGSAWSYGVVLGVVALDGFLPLMPGELVVLSASALAGRGLLSVELVLLATVLAVVIGDNVSYLLGQRLGARAARRLFRDEKGRRRLARARRELADHGTVILVGLRPIPGARTATTFAAGALGTPWRSFLPADSVAAVVWGGWGVALGFLGGHTFGGAMWMPLVFGLVLAGLISATAEALRRRRLAHHRAP